MLNNKSCLIKKKKKDKAYPELLKIDYIYSSLSFG